VKAKVKNKKKMIKKKKKLKKGVWGDSVTPENFFFVFLAILL
jgi:hypothetical protein